MSTAVMEGALLRAVVSTAGVSFGLALLALANSVVTARALGPEGRGLLGAALLLVAVVRVIALLGLGDSFVRWSGMGKLKGRQRRALTLAMVVVLVVGIVGAVVALPLTPLVTQGLAVLAMTLFWTGLGAVGDLLASTARIEASLVAYNRMRLLQPVLATALVAVLFISGDLSLEMILAVQAGMGLVTVLWSSWIMRRLIEADEMERDQSSDAWTGRSMRAFLASGLGYQGIAVLGLILTHAHMYLMMELGTLAEFGLYSAVFGLSRMLAPMQLAVGSAMFARSASTSGSGGVALLAHRVTFLPMLAVAGVGALIAPWGVPLLLGQDFAAGATVFSVLLVECVVGGSAFILGQHLQARGLVRQVLVRNLVSLVPLAAAPFLVRDADPAIGVALLLLLSAFVRLTSTLWSFRREYGGLVWVFWPTRDDRRVLMSVVRRR